MEESPLIAAEPASAPALPERRAVSRIAVAASLAFASVACVAVLSTRTGDAPLPALAAERGASSSSSSSSSGSSGSSSSASASSSDDSDDDDGLSGRALGLTATNRYGALSNHTLAIYGLDFVVEPHRVTNLSVTGLSEAALASSATSIKWQIVERSDSGAPSNSTVEREATGASIEWTCTRALTTLDVRVMIWTHTGATGSAKRAVAHAVATFNGGCRYVRREIRSLADDDRWAYLNALRVVHSTSDADGRAAYGAHFISARKLAAMHNANGVCYHFARVFWTSHPAFQVHLVMMWHIRIWSLDHYQ